MMLATLLPPRIKVVRPYARRIALAALVLYCTFAACIVIVRVVLGPAAVTE